MCSHIITNENLQPLLAAFFFFSIFFYSTPNIKRRRLSNLPHKIVSSSPSSSCHLMLQNFFSNFLKHTRRCCFRGRHGCWYMTVIGGRNWWGPPQSISLLLPAPPPSSDFITAQEFAQVPMRPAISFRLPTTTVVVPTPATGIVLGSPSTGALSPSFWGFGFSSTVTAAVVIVAILDLLCFPPSICFLLQR